MFRSLGHRTDSLAMAGRSTYEDRGHYVIQRTQAEPNYWFGNRLIYREVVTNQVDRLAGAFESAFPEATHKTLSLDIPHLTVKGWNLQGFEIEHVDVMARSGPAPNVPMPDGRTIRRISSARDWDQVIALQHEIGVEQGYDQDSHLPFIQTQFEAVAERCRGSSFAWFGVFDGDLLVADMGIVWDKALARYQNVETRGTHRGRGICAALLAHVSAFAAHHVAGAQQVIVADVDGAPGRIYRRAGFALKEQLISLYRPGY
jgi:hypothetical protein